MVRYAFWRIVQAVPLIFVVIAFNFALVHFAPGDPATFLAGPDAPAEVVQNIRESMGLDEPISVQFISYLKSISHGDLGYSHINRKPVIDAILLALPNTLILTSLAFVVSVCAALAFGIWVSDSPHSLKDNLVSTAANLIYSMPEFWSAILALLVFAVLLPVFPAGGVVDIGATGLKYWLGRLHRLVLPVLVLGLGRQFVEFFRYTRSAMLETLAEDYVFTARAKGCTEQRVHYVHAFRNALLPIITVVGLRIRYLFTGAMFIEIVFNYPGIGMLMYDSVFARDYPMLMGLFLIVSAIVILANLTSDLVYVVIDPRVGY